MQCAVTWQIGGKSFTLHSLSDLMKFSRRCNKKTTHIHTCFAINNSYNEAAINNSSNAWTVQWLLKYEIECHLKNKNKKQVGLLYNDQSVSLINVKANAKVSFPGSIFSSNKNVIRKTTWKTLNKEVGKGWNASMQKYFYFCCNLT